MSGCGSPLLNLLGTCVMMFIGALGGGAFPFLAAGPTRNKADLVSGVAAGFLVGSVLGVIIPEGFEALRSQIEDGGAESARRANHYHHHSDWMIGASMVGGFMLMLILDSPSGSHNHAEILSDDPRQTKDVGHLLFGLVIHSVVDGLAVGVAGLAPDACIGLLVGIAMVLHKGPVAFGFTTYLLTVRHPLEQIKKDLMTFAAASPIAALLVYGVHEVMPPFLGSTGIGYLLLFSGGTFLYVACSHIIPDLLHNNNISMSRGGIMAICIGGVIPLLLTSWLGHGH